ncbi:DsrE family protein [bacterium]|nr:DsrE family protein [bacterium]MBP9806743.1 DsrE family protein [bacterium]
MKAAVIVYSDPKNGSEESLGRVFNALAATYDFKQQGDEVTLLFQGAGTRWVGELSKQAHPAHALYQSVLDKVAGVSCGCADVFGATAEVEKQGLDLIKDNPVPGTTGLPSVRKLVSDGYIILNF